MNTDTIAKAIAFLNINLIDMDYSDKISASNEAKTHILNIIEMYKISKEPVLMNLIKSITVIKIKIEKSLNEQIKNI